MVDSNIIKALFTLLRSGLWNKPIDDVSCFPLSETSWGVLYNIAVSQTVEGVLYDGVQKLSADFFPPRNILLNWIVKVDRIEKSNITMNKCIEQQSLFFKKLNVNPVLLKGQAVGRFYPNPFRRVCGDIDWYFNDVNESKEVERVLKTKNIKIFRSTVDSCNYSWKTCEVEHHTKLFDIFNPFARRKLVNIQQVEWENFHNGNNSLNYSVLPPGLNIVQVNLHILKHLLSFGVGLRQFCDSAILYANLEDEYDKDWLLKLYKDIGVINWINVLHDLLVNYIGLSPQKLPFSLKENVSSEWMVEDILATGNFGFYDDRYIGRVKNNKLERKNTLRKLWSSFQQYLPLAPYEAISFPLVHFLERFKSLTIG